jgi:hypothetical protein
LVPGTQPKNSTLPSKTAPQASIFLQWAQAISADAGGRGRDLVIVNLDETAVARLVAHR